MSRWFCNKGLAPRPSIGASTGDQGAQAEKAHPASAAEAQTAKGLAAVAVRPNQNTPSIPSTESVPPARGWPGRARVRWARKVKAASTRPQRTIDPSRAAQPAARVKISGVPVRWLSAT